jgi:hypothetical protein
MVAEKSGRDSSPMKKVLIIVGIIGVAGFTALVVILLFFISEARRAVGPALYSSMGASIRIQEYAHAAGKTNYIAYADNQVTLVQGWINDWQKTAENADPAKLHELETNAYVTMDKNIKNGVNPLAFLDETNSMPLPASVSTNR